MKIKTLKPVDRVGALIAFLKNQSKDEVFTGRELEDVAGFPIVDMHIFNRARSTRLKDYCERTSVPGRANVWVYGNPAAIKALRTQIGEAQ